VELLTSDTARWMLAVWFLFLGGAVGSFLNVVVYRLPLGMSITWPGSHCPHCHHPIRPYDNVPVLAWFWLRGRCRDCRQWISTRYPLVEAVTAGLFLLLFLVEVIHGGQNLPCRLPEEPRPYSPPQTLCICLLHLGLLSTLMAAGLIHWDGKRPTPRLFLPLLLVGMIAPPLWRWLHPQSACSSWAQSRWAGIFDSLLGLGAGLVVGRTAKWLGKRFRRMRRLGNQLLGPALLIGVVLGWQAVVVLVPLALLLEWLSRSAAARWTPMYRFSAVIWTTPLALFWVLNWTSLIRLVAWLRLG